LLWIGDEREHLHRGTTAVAAKSVHLVDLSQQSCPSGAGLPGGDGLVSAVLGSPADVESAVLRVLLLPSLGGQAKEVRLAHPCPPGSVVGKAVQEFQDELAAKKVSREVTPRCMEWLAKKGYSQYFGAREISRLVSTKLKDFFVDEILFGRLSGGGRAVMDVENDDVVISIPGSAAENPPPEQPLP